MLTTHNTKGVILDNEHSRYWLGKRDWAQGVLGRDDTRFPNGKSAHEVANQILEQAELELIDDYALQVIA